MAGRPDADRFADERQRDAAATASARVGCASTSTATPNTNPSVTRRRARARASAPSSAPCSAGAAARRSRCGPPHHLVDGDVVEAPRRALALPLVMTHALRRTATPDVAPAHGPLRCGKVGPKRPTSGVPTAAARCSGPVSPDTISARLATSATSSASVVGGASSRRAGRCGHDGARERRPRPAPTARPRAEPVLVAQRARDFAEALRRPALVRPRRAGIDERERPPPCAARPAGAGETLERQRKRDLGGVDADRAAAARGSSGSRVRRHTGSAVSV